MRVFQGKKYIAVLLLIPILFGACKKSKEHKLIGSWKLETFSLKPNPDPAYWTFDAAGVVKMYKDDPEAYKDSLKAKYSVVMKNIVVASLKIENSIPFNGYWKIEKLNSRILVICRYANLEKKDKRHPYLRREFTKVQ